MAPIDPAFNTPQAPQPIENLDKRRRTQQRSNVPTLWRLCISFIGDNLDLYTGQGHFRFALSLLSNFHSAHLDGVGFENVPIEWRAEIYVYLSRRGKLTDERFVALLDENQQYIEIGRAHVRTPVPNANIV